VNYKLVLLGNSSVGKSSCVNRFVRNEFLDFRQPTIGAAFVTKSVQLDDVIVKFEIWDTAGQERYRSLAPMYYRGAACALVVFDITDRSSFEGARSWISELQSHVTSGNDLVLALAGNKCDLPNRTVSAEEGEAFAAANNCVYYETSAKTGENVDKIFDGIARRLPKCPPSKRETRRISVANPPPSDPKACCY